jgi:CysZ protein
MTAERGDPREGGAVVRLFRGFGYLFQGWGFVFGQHPSLIKYCLAPLLINLVVFAAVAFGLYHYYGELVAWIWARPDSWLLRLLWYAMYIFILAAVVLLAYFTFFVVQSILSAPFNDLLSERVEALAFGREPPAFSSRRLLRDLGLTLLHELAKLSIYAAVMVPLFLVNLVVPVIGTALFAVGGGYMTAVFFAYDFLDYSMARRGWRFGRKWGTLRAHRALTLGFGGSLATALLVPVIGLLCVPMAAVGGTLLFCDLERAGAFAQEPGGAPGSAG